MDLQAFYSLYRQGPDSVRGNLPALPDAGAFFACNPERPSLLVDSALTCSR